MTHLDPLKASDVKDARTLCNWASANLGVPPPRAADFPILNKKAKALFESVPGTDWQTIVQVMKWCHQNKRRYGRIWSYVDQYPFAWAADAVVLPVENAIEEAISEACRVEKDPLWKTRLRRAAGDHRAEVLAEWKRHREVLGASTTQRA